jgi:micrococcal nuclease
VPARHVGIIAAAPVVAVLAVLRPWDAGAGGDAQPGTAKVIEVVDGDTLVVDLEGRDEHVRLIGIDTPETVAPNRPDECYGAEASHHLAELVPPGSVVRLERDIEARDLYDRLLAYVHRTSDGLFVNLAQVADGYAETLAYPPNTAHSSDFEEAQRRARSAGAGLWTACGSADVPIG